MVHDKGVHPKPLTWKAGSRPNKNCMMAARREEAECKGSSALGIIRRKLQDRASERNAAPNNKHRRIALEKVLKMAYKKLDTQAKVMIILLRAPRHSPSAPLALRVLSLLLSWNVRAESMFRLRRQAEGWRQFRALHGFEGVPESEDVHPAGCSCGGPIDTTHASALVPIDPRPIGRPVWGSARTRENVSASSV